MNVLERQGFATLIGRLSTMGKGAVRAVRGAVRNGQKILQAGIEQRAIKAKTDRRVHGHLIQPGGLQASFGSMIGRTKSDGSFAAKTGLAVGKSRAMEGEQVSRGKTAVPYGHLLTLGTDERFTGEKTSKGRKGRIYRKKTHSPVMYRGRVKPKAHIVQAAEATKGAAEAKMLESLEAAIAKDWGR